MASVRMSQDLRSTIIRNAKDAFDRSTPEPQLSTTDIDWFAESVFQSGAHKKALQLVEMGETFPTMPAQYYGRDHIDAPVLDLVFPKLNKISRFELVYRNSSGYKRSLGFYLNSPKRFACSQRNGHETLCFSVNIFDNNDDMLKAKKIVDDYHERLKAYKSKKESFVEHIENLVRKCTTLKQFVDTWDAGKAFVPEHLIQKMHEKVTRAQRAKKIKEEIEFDDSVVNQVVLTSKLMGA